jgi:hypothetical protein
MNSQVIAVIVIVVVVAAVAIAVGILGQQKRAKELRAIAAQRGYHFAEQEAGLVDTLSGFALFSQARAHARNATNLLRTEADGAAAAIFDYNYTVGLGKNQRSSTQSVLLFESERLNLPAFALRPEGLGQKLQGALGQQDIDFEEQPGFSSAYVLQGPDEAQIRAFFDSEKLAFFAQRRGLCVEGDGRRLLYYRASKRVSPQAIPSFVEEGLATLHLLAGE